MLRVSITINLIQYDWMAHRIFEIRSLADPLYIYDPHDKL